MSARHTASLRRLATLLPRLALVVMVLVSPLAGIKAIADDGGVTIEAPARKNSGVGFVLLVSLQRG